jgi:hypothetical protein
MIGRLVAPVAIGLHIRLRGGSEVTALPFVVRAEGMWDPFWLERPQYMKKGAGDSTRMFQAQHAAGSICPTKSGFLTRENLAGV